MIGEEIPKRWESLDLELGFSTAPEGAAKLFMEALLSMFSMGIGRCFSSLLFLKRTVEVFTRLSLFPVSRFYHPKVGPLIEVLVFLQRPPHEKVQNPKNHLEILPSEVFAG